MKIHTLAFAAVFAIAIAGQNAFAAGLESEERIEQVLTLFVANPSEELPVTQHPVKPQQVFSRHFNISRSARAYLQLSTDPSQDAYSSALLQEVAQYYIDNPIEIPDPDATYWAGEYHAAALAMFGINGTVRKGAISRDAEITMLEYMVDYLNYWSRPDRYQFSLEHQTYYYWNSENHWWQEIVTSWGYLLALKDDPDFRDTKLADGKTLQEHYEVTVAYMKEHMRQRAKKGFFVEISSGGYSGRMHNMYYLIHDISPDEDLKALAAKTLDLWWSFWAEEQISGERGGGKVRHRRLRGLLPNTEIHMVPAWYYFGIGTRNKDYLKDLDGDSTVMAGNYMALLSNYRPAPIIYKILADRETAPAYAITQRRVGKSAGQDEDLPEALIAPNPERDLYGNTGIPKHKFFDYENGSVLKYSWVSPNFILGTNMRPPYDVQEWVAGQAQSWWHGLLLKSNKTGYPDRVVPTLIYPSDSMGEQYAVQSKTSFMARKLNDSWSQVSDNTDFPMGVFVSEGLKNDTTLDGDFIFIEGPTAWVAVRAAKTGFARSDEILTAAQQNAGNFYLLETDTQPVIIEVAEHGDYTDFTEFEATVRNAKLSFENGAYHYESLSGDRLTMFDDRSAPMINDQTVNFHPAMAYDSRYISSAWDSGIITITVGDELHVIDFTVH
ncbi:hypothetical protein [Aquisalinus flavus]|uniref:Uncharacterized protein n=1 Tax=Aquisalinus flavus TaxID=1526572 RepID=A0A8J2V5Y6_9PROT|nr:hypothetical protein [Aquisalinus flavus]MBD0425948.1 hypothetical protein [Aquisalinus flavus]UNE48459.1 hypothetical protein FF099_10565 [Aquisalinus flavus]GGD11946.1 hypothetical protein GCM10011342_20950 [Aquisalinus flavus]